MTPCIFVDFSEGLYNRMLGFFPVHLQGVESRFQIWPTAHITTTVMIMNSSAIKLVIISLKNPNEPF